MVLFPLFLPYSIGTAPLPLSWISSVDERNMETDRQRRMEESERWHQELVTCGRDIMINVIPAGSEEMPSIDRNTKCIIYDKTSWNEIKLFLISRWSSLLYPLVSWLTSISLIHIYWQQPHTRSHHVPHHQHALDSWRPRARVHNHVSLLSDKAVNEPSAKFSQSRRRPLLGPSPGWKRLVEVFSVIVKTSPKVR